MSVKGDSKFEKKPYFVSVCPECDNNNYIQADRRAHFPWTQRCAFCGAQMTWNFPEIVYDEELVTQN